MVKTIFKVMSGLDMVTSGFIVGETGAFKFVESGKQMEGLRPASHSVGSRLQESTP
jgi:hypothetical protein